MKAMAMGVFATALSAYGAVACATAPAEAGLWRFDIRYDFVGIPQTFPAYQKTQCLTADNLIPDISRPGQECKLESQRTFGRVHSWQVDCSTEWETAQGMGRITYTNGKAKGDVHIQILNPYNPPEFMVFYVEGKRLGDCKK